MGAFSKNPSVQIFVPAYNSRSHIEEAIDSLINQTYKNIEIVVLDDGSTDDTASYVESCYGQKNVKVHRSASNEGVGVRRQQALDIADAELMFFMDSDDIVHPTRISRQVDALMSGRIDVCGTWSLFFSEDRLRRHSPLIHDQEIKAAMLFAQSVTNASLGFRTRKLKEIGACYSSRRVAEDYEFIVKYMDQLSFYCVPRFLYFIRARSTSLSKTLSEPSLQASLNIMQAAWEQRGVPLCEQESRLLRQLNAKGTLDPVFIEDCVNTGLKIRETCDPKHLQPIETRMFTLLVRNRFPFAAFKKLFGGRLGIHAVQYLGQKICLACHIALSGREITFIWRAARANGAKDLHNG